MMSLSDIHKKYLVEKYLQQELEREKQEIEMYKWKMMEEMTRYKETDDLLIDELEKYMKPKIETEHEKVVRILKGDFEKKFGMTFERFIEVYHDMMEQHPEKLI